MGFDPIHSAQGRSRLISTCAAGSAWRAICTARAVIRICSSSERPRTSLQAGRWTKFQTGTLPR